MSVRVHYGVGVAQLHLAGLSGLTCPGQDHPRPCKVAEEKEQAGVRDYQLRVFDDLVWVAMIFLASS